METTRGGSESDEHEGRLAAIVERFEAAWQDCLDGGDSPLDDFDLPTDPALRRVVRFELSLIDLEYRLKRGEQARVEDYLERFPELQADWRAVVQLTRADSVSPSG